MRCALLIEYDGTNYGGWQRQKNAVTIQQRVEEALARITGEESVVHSSGRTDAGVHARGQVAHFDTQSRIPPQRIAYALNSTLPEDIRILQSVAAPDSFHARFAAKRKTYRYSICNTYCGTALYRNLAAHVPGKLDAAAMEEGARNFIGEQDFKACMAAGSPVRSTVRTMYSCTAWREDNMVFIETCANGFLYNMVRIIAGTLIRIGQGKMAPADVKEILAGRNRVQAGFTAPARGLCLQNVDYGFPLFEKEGEGS